MVDDFKDEEKGIAVDVELLEDRAKGIEDIEKPANMMKEYKHLVAQMLVLVTIVTNIISVGVFQTASIIASSVSALLISPTVLYKEQKLKEIDSMRETQNELRNQVNEVIEEKERLELTVDSLVGEVKDLEQSQQHLNDIAGKHGKSVDELRTLLADNEDTIMQLKRVSLAQLSSQIVSITIMSDFTGDGALDDTELDLLITRMKDIKHLNINEKKLRKKINALSDKSVIGILQLLAKVDEYDFGETFEKNNDGTADKKKDRALLDANNEDDGGAMITFLKNPLTATTATAKEQEEEEEE